MGKAVKKIGLIVATIAIAVVVGPQAALAFYAIGSTALGLNKPGAMAAQIGRLSLSFDPDASRKAAFGTTALATDMLYSEPSGADQEYHDYIIAVAAHAVHSIDEIRTDDKLLWNSAGGTQGIYVGYADITVRTEGTAGNAIPINGGGTWTSNCRLTGCAYIHLRIKRTGNTKKADSPFAGGLPSRMTIIGKGMNLYDPRRDSTRGGSGSHRADNQATWEYAPSGVEIGQNPALQALTYLLGWKIGGVLSVGVGMPPARIDFADFITAANICDEAVTLAAGGTHRRYEAAGIFGDDSDGGAVLSEICKHMVAEMRDVNGKLGIRLSTNDLGGALPAFTIDDVLGSYEWSGFAALNDTNNVVRGKFTDPSTASLYATAPYTKVGVTSVDGIDRPETLDLLMCQNAERAQRIAVRVLLRNQSQGVFTADFGPRAWAVRVGDPLVLTFQPAGLLAQKVRVIEQLLKVVTTDEGAETFCRMTLRVEDGALYAYTPGVVALPASAITAVSYNPFNNPLAITDGSDIGVDDDATNANNLQFNALLSNDTEGYNLTTGWMARAAGIAGPPTPWVLSTTAASSAGAQTIFPKSKVAGGRRVISSIWVLRTGSLSTLDFAANAFEALNENAGIGPVGATTSIVPAAPNVWQRFPVAGLMYSNAGYMGLTVENMTGNTGTVQVALGEISYDSAVDTNAVLEVPPEITVNADYTGVVLSGQLPRDVQATRRRGNVDVSASTTWSATSFTGCTGTVDSDGTATLTACVTSGKIGWESVRDGLTLKAETKVTKNIAAPPTTTGGGGGGGGGSGSAADSSISDATSTSYTGGNCAVLQVTAGSSGTVDLTFPATYGRVGAGSATNARGKWQWRVSGGTFADVATEISQVQSYVSGVPDSGYIEVNQSKGGLTSGTVYEFQLQLRVATGTGSLAFSGTASATPV